MADSLVLSTLAQVSRATACGLGIHGGSSLAMSILTGKVFSRAFHEWNPATLGCVKFGVFMGGFAGAYRLVHHFLQQHAPSKGKGNALMAAAVASLASSIQPPGRRHLMTLFLSSRALKIMLQAFLAKTGIKLSAATMPTLYLLNVCVLVHAALLRPTALPESYYRSLLRWTVGFSDSQIQQIFRPSSEVAVRPTCRDVVHPGRSCIHDRWHVYIKIWLQSVKIYAVIYATQLFAFRFRSLMKRPVKTIVETLKVLARSSLFLSLTTGVGSCGFCAVSTNPYIRRLNTPANGLPSLATLLPGILAGLPILIESPGRQYELALYTTPIVIHTLLQHLQFASILPQTRNFSIAFFAMSMMVIMRAYEHRRDTLPSWMVSLLNTLLH